MLYLIVFAEDLMVKSCFEHYAGKYYKNVKLL